MIFWHLRMVLTTSIKYIATYRHIYVFIRSQINNNNQCQPACGGLKDTINGTDTKKTILWIGSPRAISNLINLTKLFSFSLFAPFSTQRAPCLLPNRNSSLPNIAESGWRVISGVTVMINSVTSGLNRFSGTHRLTLQHLFASLSFQGVSVDVCWKPHREKAKYNTVHGFLL